MIGCMTFVVACRMTFRLVDISSLAFNSHKMCCSELLNFKESEIGFRISCSQPSYCYSIKFIVQYV